MIKHIWSVLCRRVIVDSSTNNVTISDVMEELRVDIKVEEKNAQSLKLITVPMEFEIVTLWQKEGDKTKHLKAECEVEALNPEGKQLKTFTQLVDIPSNMRRLRTILKVMGFIVDNPGDYILKVNIKEEGNKMYKTVAELPIEVHLNKEVVSELPRT